MPAHILAVVHHAGGVGKTTSTLNLGWALSILPSLRGPQHRVLLVDLDPQADLSARLGIQPEPPTLGDLLLGTPGEPTIAPLRWDRGALDLLPSTLDMAGAEMRLVTAHARERRLERILAPLREYYDWILLDCPPSLSVLTTNALHAADGVLIPVQAHDKAFNAIPLVLSTIREVNQYRERPLPVFGILATMVDNTTMAGQIVNAMRTSYPDLMFETFIPSRAATRAESRYHAPIGVYDPRNEAAIAYTALAEEVVARA